MTDARFWSKVDKTTECWLWTSAMSSGYGVFLIEKGKTIRSHRYSWILTNGEIQDNLIVRHKCRNRNCVNPGHLELGTHQDNSQDRVRDQTDIRGSKNPTCKLTQDKVLEIRRRASENYLSLAKEFNVSHSTIKNIINRRRWDWL
jgi:hypothetical protein